MVPYYVSYIDLLAADSSLSCFLCTAFADNRGREDQTKKQEEEEEEDMEDEDEEYENADDCEYEQY